MMDGLRVFLRRIMPGLEDLQDEEIEFVHQMGINNPTFEIGKALGHQRRRYAFGWHRRQGESLELVNVPSRAVADGHDFVRQFQRRNGDYALFRGSQRRMAKISVADDTGDQRRLETPPQGPRLHHHVPRHHHHVGAALVCCGQQNHRTRFEQLVDLCEWKSFHYDWTSPWFVPAELKTPRSILLHMATMVHAESTE